MPKAENIQIAASDGDLDDVQAFVSAGVRPDAGDGAGYTALHAAASWGHEAVLAWLLAQSGHAGPAAVDNDGDTPLHVCESASCATMLLEAAAHTVPPFDALAAANADGEVPFVVAVRERRDDVVEVLRAAYAARSAVPPTVDPSTIEGDENGAEVEGGDDADSEAAMAAVAAAVEAAVAANSAAQPPA